MAANLAKKVDECPLNWFAYSWERESCTLYRVAWCQLLKYQREWRDSQDFKNCPFYHKCQLLEVSIKWGSTVCTTEGFTMWTCHTMICDILTLLPSHLRISSPPPTLLQTGTQNTMPLV